ncbi:MAG TPA: hypothetical protein VE397_01985 [Stellaceae bacterium]|jgi:glyoxylase-like metal-dependent hydrolase (beta-lactamase superfamily II)|nr:hypothetical protein [Stellaceae bacterium]
MGEPRDVEVLGVAYVGPDCVERDTYEIVLEVRPAPGAAPEHLALRFRAGDAAFLTLAMQSNPPRVAPDERLLDHVAALGT